MKPRTWLTPVLVNCQLSTQQEWAKFSEQLESVGFRVGNNITLVPVYMEGIASPGDLMFEAKYGETPVHILFVPSKRDGTDRTRFNIPSYALAYIEGATGCVCTVEYEFSIPGQTRGINGRYTDKVRVVMSLDRLWHERVS